jgi:Spy/CpxP family protein refolding chaperone
MTQTLRTKSGIVIAGLLTGVAWASLPAFAQTNAPAPGADQGSGMMQHGMPNGGAMKPGMMMDQDMQQKMSRMMDNCNRMMESVAPNSDSTPTRSAPTNKG